MTTASLSTANLLSVENLQVRTPEGRELASGVSFALPPGKCVVISGPNGSGKSTLLKSLLGLAPVKVGCVRYSIDMSEVGYLPQFGNMRFHLPLTLGDLLDHSPFVSQGSVSQGTDQAIQEGLISPDLLRRSWNTASGGERQRTLITRALLRKPRVLALDEPLNHLDPDSRRICLRLLSDFLKGANGVANSIVMISHEDRLGDFPVHREIRLGRSGSTSGLEEA